MVLQLAAGQFLGRPGRADESGRFRVSESRYAGGEVLPQHSHETPHFCLVLAGGYRERVRGRDWERSPLSLAWYPSDADHAERHDRDGRHLLIEVPASAVDGAALPAEPSLLDDGRMAVAAQRVWVELVAGDAYAMEDAAFQLLAFTSKGRSGRGAPAWLAEVDDALRAHFVSPPRVPELAALAGVHPVHLARVFRRHHGESIADAVRRHRVRAAAQQLCDTSATIASVAANVGFADQSHMTRAFQALLRTTPGRWRRSMR